MSISGHDEISFDNHRLAGRPTRSNSAALQPIEKRRALVSAVVFGAATSMWPVRSHSADDMRRVAFLSAGDPTRTGFLTSAFSSALLAHGWLPEKTLRLDFRYAVGDFTQANRLTRELLALGPHVIVASTDAYAQPAATLTKTIPIIFVLGFDPVGLGLVKSLSEPGVNVTGFSVLNYELNQKRLALLKEAMPQLNRIAIIYRPGDSRAKESLADFERAASSLRLAVLPVPVAKREDIAGAVESIASAGVKAMMNVPEPLFLQERVQFAELALRYRIAASFGAMEYADAGMLLSYGTDFKAVYVRAAALVDRVLRGADPAHIPVEQANVYDLVINLRTARALQIEVPRTMLLSATRLIE